jgi:hypothetical protein
MTDEEQIGAVVDEMYAMISGPAGPRDWSRQANCFLPDALQVRTSVDEHGRAQKLSMTLEEYEAGTTPFFNANAFYEVETSRRIDRLATSRMCGAAMRRAPRPTTLSRSAAGSTRSSCSNIPTMAGGSST